MDELAYKIGMDPVAFRKINLKDEVYHRQLDRGAREIGWARRNPVAGGNTGPLKRGMGCAVGTWGGGGNNQCKVDVTVSPDGSVSAASLSPSVKDAAIKARLLLVERIAPLLDNAKAEEITFSGGNVSGKG